MEMKGRVHAAWFCAWECVHVLVLDCAFTINHRYVGVQRAGLCPGSHHPRAPASCDEIQEDAVQSQVCSLNLIFQSFLKAVHFIIGCEILSELFFVVACLFFFSVNGELKTISLAQPQCRWGSSQFFEGIITSFPDWPLPYRMHISSASSSLYYRVSMYPLCLAVLTPFPESQCPGLFHTEWGQRCTWSFNYREPSDHLNLKMS